MEIERADGINYMRQEEKGLQQQPQDDDEFLLTNRDILNEVEYEEDEDDWRKECENDIEEALQAPRVQIDLNDYLKVREHLN